MEFNEELELDIKAAEGGGEPKLINAEVFADFDKAKAAPDEKEGTIIFLHWLKIDRLQFFSIDKEFAFSRKALLRLVLGKRC